MYLASCAGILTSASGCILGERDDSGRVSCHGTPVAPRRESDLPTVTEGWPTSQYDAHNTGYNPAAAGVPGRCGALHWRYSLGEETEVWGGASVHDGTVYVATFGTLYALDAQRGTERWQVRLRGGGLSTPTIADGLVYVGGDGVLQAIDIETRRERWHLPTEETFDRTDDWIVAAPTVADGRVVAGTTGGVLHAVDAQTGERHWEVQAPVPNEAATPGPNNSRAFRASPAVAGDTVYASNMNGRLYAFDAATGDRRWAFDAGQRIEAAPTVVGETVYVTNGSEVIAVDATDGTRRWTYRDEPGSAITSPAVADGTLYTAVGPSYGNLSVTAIDLAEQSVRWRQGGRPQDDPSVGGDTVYIGLYGDVVALDASTGTQQWRLATESVLGAAPAVVDGAVYVADKAGVVYGIGGNG